MAVFGDLIDKEISERFSKEKGIIFISERSITQYIATVAINRIGYPFYIFNNPRDAVLCYSKIYHLVLFLVIDVGLSDVGDGADAVKSIMSIDDCSRVLSISSFGMPSLVRKVCDSGSSCFIMKPLCVDSFVSRLGKYIESL